MAAIGYAARSRPWSSPASERSVSEPSLIRSPSHITGATDSSRKPSSILILRSIPTSPSLWLPKRQSSPTAIVATFPAQIFRTKSAASISANASSKWITNNPAIPCDFSNSALSSSVASSELGAFPGAMTRIGCGENVTTKDFPPRSLAASTARAMTAWCPTRAPTRR